MRAPAAYVPIDVAAAALDAHGRAAAPAAHPGLAVHPVAADFLRPLAPARARSAAMPLLGFFPGSTIGNLEPRGRAPLPRRGARRRSARGALFLVGVDLRKDPAVLDPRL